MCDWDGPRAANQGTDHHPQRSCPCWTLSFNSATPRTGNTIVGYGFAADPVRAMCCSLTDDRPQMDCKLLAECTPPPTRTVHRLHRDDHLDARERMASTQPTASYHAVKISDYHGPVSPPTGFRIVLVKTPEQSVYRRPSHTVALQPDQSSQISARCPVSGC